MPPELRTLPPMLVLQDKAATAAVVLEAPVRLRRSAQAFLLEFLLGLHRRTLLWLQLQVAAPGQRREDRAQAPTPEAPQQPIPHPAPMRVPCVSR